MGKGFRPTDEALAAILKRPGYRVRDSTLPCAACGKAPALCACRMTAAVKTRHYGKTFGASVASHPAVKTAQRASNALAKALLDPTDENQQRAAHALRVAAAARGEIEAIFQLQLLDAFGKGELAGNPVFQHKPIAKRKFRLDVAFLANEWRNLPIAIEVQGHVHRIKHQFLRDMERHNLLVEAGWKIFYVSGDMVRNGRALELARRVINA